MIAPSCRPATWSLPCWWVHKLCNDPEAIDFGATLQSKQLACYQISLKILINIWNITTSNLDWQSMLISKPSKSIGLQIHNRPGIRGKIKQLLVIHCDRNEVCSQSAVVYSWPNLPVIQPEPTPVGVTCTYIHLHALTYTYMHTTHYMHLHTLTHTYILIFLSM